VRHSFRFRPHARRALIGWLVIHPALLENEAVAQRDAFSETSFRGLETWLEGRCVAQIGTDGDETPVADFLAFMADDLACEAAARVRQGSAETIAAFELLSDRVRARIDRYRESPHDPVGALDRWARQVTRSCYEDQPDASVASQIGSRLAETETIVIAAAGAPFEAVEPWRVHGATRFRVDGGPAWQVELTLGVAPDSQSWHAVGYVLLHEFVSHVAQGPWTAACTQPGPDDAFAEGWMDFVAHLLHGIYVYGAGAPAVEETVLPDNPRARHLAAGTLHYGRCELSRPGTFNRRHGCQVAASFNCRLLGAQSAPADEAFLALSLQLNASAASHKQREAFVFGIETACEIGAPIDRWVDEYRVTGRLDTLLDPILALAAERYAGRSALA
jgi:hypothetical protein